MTFCGYCVECASGHQSLCSSFSVLGYANDGANCEYIAVPRINVVPIPDSVEFSFEQAASVPLVFTTAWHMLVGRCAIKPGDTVLVLAAGSGVGIAAVQIAKLFNAKVIATAGDEQKLAKAFQLGADFGINHYKQSISGEVKKITGGGVDIVFEHVGSATWLESMKSMKPGGKLVTCGATTGFDAKFDIRFLFARQLSFLGSYMGTMGELHEVVRHVFSGKLKPVVDRSFPLKEARAAHEYLESSSQFGKVVLVP
jgi:NADPH:quinone reductase-like Zn-dependent oxidoreductase